MGRPFPFAPSCALALVVLAALTGCAGQSDSASEASALIDEAVSDQMPGCSAAVAVDGTVRWADQKGLADIADATPIDSSTRFNFGSVAKQFTATAILALEESGTLRVDDALADHIGGLPDWARQVTLRHLMHHRSGIRDADLSSVGAGTQEDYLGALRAGEGHREGVTAYEYADTNYVLLAIVAEQASGAQLADWLDQNLFDPLEVALELRFQATAADIATGYAEAEAPFHQAEDVIVAPGPSSILGTPGELARWGDHYRGSDVPSQQSLDAALADAEAVPDDPGTSYGPGMVILRSGGLAHYGVDAGMLTFFGVSADRETSLAISCNAPLNGAKDLADRLAEVWLGDDFFG